MTNTVASILSRESVALYVALCGVNLGSRPHMFIATAEWRRPAARKAEVAL